MISILTILSVCLIFVGALGVDPVWVRAPLLVVAPVKDIRSEAEILAAATIAAMPYGMNPWEIVELVRDESGFDRLAPGQNGEMSHGQIKTGTWKDFKCRGEPFNTLDNLRCVARILDHRKRACGRYRRALDSYKKGTRTCPGPKHDKSGRVLDITFAVELRNWMPPKILEE